MRIPTVLSFFAVSALLIAGCASADGQSITGESVQELSSQHDAKLFGAYNFNPAGGPSLGFSHLVLESDGTFFEDRDIYCIKAPCPVLRTSGIWSSTSYARTGRGQLTLKAQGERSINFQVSMAGDDSSIKLALTTTSPAALLDRVATYCDTAQDCDGQPMPAFAQMCMLGLSKQTVCTDNACASQCLPTPECATDSDCRLFDDYCTGCDCRALSTSASDPTCDGPGVRCVREPCGGHTATCDSGKCTVH